MLLVTSNWCVPDGSLLSGPTPGLVAAFREEVRRASLRAGVRADGQYEPVPGIAIVFAGDTFDWLTSSEWTGDVRPWEATRRAADARDRVAARSLRPAARLLATLSTWARRGLGVPDATRRGRPLAGSSVAVPVRISVLRGDRDRWIDRLGGGFGTAAMSVGHAWSDGSVTVRHGEEIEFPWQGDGREPTLGESLAVEVIARFGGSIADDARLRPRMAAMLRGIVMGRLGDAPTRLACWLGQRQRAGVFSASDRSAVVDAWNRAVCVWHRVARRLHLGRSGGIDMLDPVAEAMSLATDVGAAWGDELPRMRRLVADAETAGEGRGPCEILGHPPVGFEPPSSWRSRALGIGPAAVSAVGRSRAVPGEPDAAKPVVFDPPGSISRFASPWETPIPAAAVVAARPAGPRLDWLPLGGPFTVADGRSDEDVGHGIWRSRPSMAEDRVVDAA